MVVTPHLPDRNTKAFDGDRTVKQDSRLRERKVCHGKEQTSVVGSVPCAAHEEVQSKPAHDA